MFRVRGTCAEDVVAVQVAEVAASLNAEDVFVLETPSNTWIWVGQGSNPDEQELASGICQVVAPGRDPEVIQEGSEPGEFWSAIGGQGDYSKAINLDKPILEPRLYHARILGSGKMRWVEINNFTKEDLQEDDVMILDSGAELYVWIGKDASDEEKSQALALAKEYLAKDPTERDENNTLIFTVKQGEEPSSFTCVFPSFD